MIKIYFTSFCLFFVLLFGSNLSAQINWMSIDDAYKAYEKNPKPIYIDVYTDWCGWCKKMDQSTFKDPHLANYLNTYFYPVKLNAETHEDINFMGKKYQNTQFLTGKKIIDSLNTVNLTLLKGQEKLKSPTGQEDVTSTITANEAQINQIKRKLSRTTHNFAIDLMRGQMSYPTSIFLFDSLRGNFPAKGALQADQLLAISAFFGEGVYKHTRELNDFQELNKKAAQLPQQQVQWLDLTTAVKLQYENPKKILLLVDNPNSVVGQTMLKGTFEADDIAQIVNEEFYPVYLSVFEANTIKFQDKDFQNVNGIHQLAVALLDGTNQFPFFCVLDEKQQLNLKIAQFFFPKDFALVLEFIYSKAYISLNFQQWVQSKLPNE